MKYLFALFLIIGGVALTLYGVITVSDARASQSWPSVEGEIIESRVREFGVSKPPNKTNLRETKYGTTIVYKYQVDGQEYQADIVSYDEIATRQRSKAEGVLANFPVGSTHKIYYKPSNPKVAVLKPGMSGQSYAIPVIGVVVFILGVLALKSMVNRKRRVR